MYRLFLQDSLNDCSAACLATLLCYHGRYVTPVDLSKQMEMARGGATNKELLQIAESHGLQGKTISLPLDQFDRIEEPCLALLRNEGGEGKHLVVVFRVKKGRVLIGDPARGKKWMTRATFAKHYLEVLLIFRKSDDFKAEKVSEPYIRKFFRFIMVYRASILKTLVIGGLTSAGAFGLIYFSKVFVDNVLPENDYGLIVGFALAFLVAKGFVVAMRGANDLFTVHIKNKISKSLSERFLKESLDLEKRHIDSRDVGDFLYQFSNIDSLTENLSSYFSNFVLVVFGMVVKAGFLIWLYDPGLVSIILGIVALNSISGMFFSRLTSEHSNRRSLVYSHINTALINAMSDIRVVRIFNAKSWVGQIYSRLLDEGQALFRRIRLLNVWGRSGAELLSILAEVAIFLICGLHIIEGTYTIGDLLVFLSLSQSLTSESLQFPGLILSFQSQLRGFARLQAVQELTKERRGGLIDDQETIEIEFRNVSFGYVRGFPVLKGLSFKLSAGRTTALVGQSGSGKSTIMNLLMGFYVPWSGKILVNGSDLHELDLDRYRQVLSAVFQDTPIFNKDLINNVSLGNPDITEARVREVAELLGIGDFIRNLPEGYEQLIHQGYLSGGQTQRVGILRALVKPFKLLCLDEATSHLDSLTEKRIVDGINTVASGKTRLVIAHRLSTVMEADQILVLEDGEIVECGNHTDLIESHGPYLALIQRQYEVNLAPSPA